MLRTTQDRRFNKRFPIHLPIHFRVSLKGVASRWNTGTTCDISSGGLSFRCRRALPIGAHVEMLIDWPARNEDTFTVSLQSTGFIVRSDGNKAAVRMTAHQFRADTAQAQPIGQTA
ncbi:MAG TPA: PilZ domain-containing protein [Candidatus Acidoferrales bacterium]|nr:PilZ domain-containing protein [Candidatus Acidoferrales bacterium]